MTYIGKAMATLTASCSSFLIVCSVSCRLECRGRCAPGRFNAQLHMEMHMGMASIMKRRAGKGQYHSQAVDLIADTRQTCAEALRHPEATELPFISGPFAIHRPITINGPKPWHGGGGGQTLVTTR